MRPRSTFLSWRCQIQAEGARHPVQPRHHALGLPDAATVWERGKNRTFTRNPARAPAGVDLLVAGPGADALCATNEVNGRNAGRNQSGGLIPYRLNLWKMPSTR